MGSADFQRLSFGVYAERMVDIVSAVLKPYAAGAVVAGYCHIGVEQFRGFDSVICDLPARLVGDDVPVFKGQTFAVLQVTECVNDVLFHWIYLSFLCDYIIPQPGAKVNSFLKKIFLFFFQKVLDNPGKMVYNVYRKKEREENKMYEGYSWEEITAKVKEDIKAGKPLHGFEFDLAVEMALQEMEEEEA